MCYRILRAAYLWFVRQLTKACNLCRRCFGYEKQPSECSACLLPMTNEDPTLTNCWQCRRRDNVTTQEWSYLQETASGAGSSRSSRSLGKRKGFAGTFSIRRLQRCTDIFSNEEKRFALLNVNGIKGKFPEICELLAKNKDILVLALTDCRTTENDKYYTIPSLQLVKVDGRSTEAGGQLIYVHSTCTYDMIRLPCKPPGGVECNILSIKRDEMPRTTLCVIYVPQEDVRDAFCQFFSKVCKHVKSSSRRVIILGNFNVDWLDDNAYKRRLVETMSEYNLTQLVDVPTKGNTLVDHIYVNYKDSAGAVAAVDVNASTSEHSLISVIYK